MNEKLMSIIRFCIMEKKSFFGLSEFVKDTQTFTDLEFREMWKMDKILKIWKNFKG